MTPEEKLAALADRPRGLDDTLGVRYETKTADEVVALMDVAPHVHQPFGYLHGGATIALAESAASLGGYLRAPDGHAAFGMTVAANHVRPVRDGTLRAVAVCIHTGRTSQVWDVRVADERDRSVCLARITLAVVSQ